MKGETIEQRDALISTLEKSDLTIKCKWCGLRVKALVRRLKKNTQAYCPSCKKCIRSMSKTQKKMIGPSPSMREEGYVTPIDLRKLPYAKYLESKHWRSFRRGAIDRAGRQCQVCNSKGGLDVHHRTYDRLGCEDRRDVIVLCRGCHALFHTNGKLA